MNPRDRIASHLRRILVAAGMALPQIGHADTSTPSGNKGKTPTKKDPPKSSPARPPTGHHYEVVDMLPEPYIERKETGTLELRSNPPGATILIDGKDPGKKTPLNKWKLAAGVHAVTVKLGGVIQNFTVEIMPGETHVETRDLRPLPSPEPKK
jgi:hypothetical protein